MSDIQRAGAFARIRIKAEQITESTMKLGAYLDREGGTATNADLERVCWHLNHLATVVRELASIVEEAK